jgi:peptidoglycan/LPS O-acetylase OafA/YrhL
MGDDLARTGGIMASDGAICVMIIGVTSDGRSSSRLRAFVVGGTLTPEQRRWRLRRHGILALIGVVVGVVGLVMSVLVPGGSAVHSVAAGLAGLGVAVIVVAGLAVGADRLR